MSAINCDQVFDILTRGPFPSGDSSDEPVEKHLACCHECRQLAEALRPAVELLHEAIDSEESADLPGYRGSLRGLAPAASPVAVELATLGELRRGLGLPPMPGWLSSRGWSGLVWFRVAATLILGAGVGILAYACLQPGEGEKSAAAPARTTPLAKHLPSAEGERLLASLDMRPACRLSTGSRTDDAAAMSADLSRFTTAGGFICCLQCHSGERFRDRAETSTTTTNQCTICHR